MSGLLDIWKEWRDGSYSPKGYTWGSQETDVDIGSSFPARTNLDTAGGTNNTYQGTKVKRGQFNTDPKYIRQNPEVRNRLGKVVEQGTTVPNAKFNTRFSKPDQENTSKGVLANNLAESSAKTQNTYVGDGPWKMRSGADSKFHENGGEQLKWWETLANKVGFDPEKAKATWEKKGGFEGLMANPAFTMGLAFLQAGAEGKNIGQGALDNVMKAGGISQHYKKILKDRKKEPIQATATDIAEVEDILKTINIEEGNWLENIVSKAKGGNPGAEWSAAVEEIAVQFQAEIEKWQSNNLDADGSPKIIRIEDKIKIMNKLVKSGKIKKKESWFGQFTADTLSKAIPGLTGKAEGGPVEAGKPYVVGEKGPEIIIPSKDGNVLSNDDSQIYAMLLASNPQLQKVSRTRAEKILRSRFPEYFE